MHYTCPSFNSRRRFVKAADHDGGSLATTASTPVSRSISSKHLLWIVFGLMTLFVLLTRELTLLDSHSPLRQRYAAMPVLMLAHGIPGALALLLGAFQFSNRLRSHYLSLHRVVGYLYVVSVAISAPVAIVVSLRLPLPTLTMASIIQTFGWVTTTATAMYSIRTRRIQQHKEWMMRSYPFAMVFIVNRVITFFLVMMRSGELALVASVWSVLATACFLPSFVIAWQSLARSPKASRHLTDGQVSSPKSSVAARKVIRFSQT
jgi:hypothetical protein